MTTKLTKARAVEKTAPQKAAPAARKKAVPKAPPVKTAPAKSRPIPEHLMGVDIFAFEEPEEKTPVRTSEEPREKASEPVATAERERPAGQSRPADSKPSAEAQQTTIEALTKLTYTELYPLWKRLNKGKGIEDFTTLRKPDDLPKARYMRKAEALHRGIIPNAQPARGALYCPYCMMYMPFHNDTYMGYVRCCGCGISTKDYHTRGDNPHA